MLFETAHVRIAAEYGTATLWLGFPGDPANALDLAGLRELEAAIRFLEATPSLRIVVVRSAQPGGFCAGIRPAALAALTHAADRAAFAWYAQQIADRLARLDAITVAAIDGPCLGAGLELALACDYRLCVASPRTILGFPEKVTCCGGLTRLRALLGRQAGAFVGSGAVISGREARDRRLVDLAYCERRSRIELRTFLDRLELRPLKPRRRMDPFGFAAERRAFAAACPPPSETRQAPSFSPSLRFPLTIGLLGSNRHAADLAADAALRGSTVLVSGNPAQVFASIEASRARGFITPLEAEQTQRRVRPVAALRELRSAALVLTDDSDARVRLAGIVLPRTIVALIERDEASDHPRVQSFRVPGPAAQPQRVVHLSLKAGVGFELAPSGGADCDAAPTLAAWLHRLGRAVRILAAPGSLPATADANTRLQSDCGHLLAQLG
jgi:enoyl-CoA hydratase/carnithine racemase